VVRLLGKTALPTVLEINTKINRNLGDIFFPALQRQEGEILRFWGVVEE
jgi:hypothetical protein